MTFKIKLKLPDGLSCKNCVLRWWWRTGNDRAVQTQMSAAWAQIESRKLSSTVLTLPSLEKPAVYRRRVYLHQQSARVRNHCQQMTLIRANARPLVTGKGDT